MTSPSLLSVAYYVTIPCIYIYIYIYTMCVSIYIYINTTYIYCYIVIYIIIQHHNDTTSKTDAWINDAGRKTQEDFFRKILTSHFIARVQKGCSRFACERVLETEHKLHILTPLLWPSRCVFLVLLDVQPEVLSSLGRVWPSLPHLVSTVWKSTGNCFGTPNSTELNNNSTPTRSPTGSLKSDV